MDAPLTLDYRSSQGIWNDKAPEGAIAVPARFDGLSIFLAADLDGKRLPLLLDTGSNVNALFHKDWQGETISRGQGQMAVADGTTEEAAKFAKVAALTIDTIDTTAPKPAEFRLTETHRCLGTPFLTGRAIHLDAKTRQVRITPNSLPDSK